MNAADVESVTGREEHPVIPLHLPAELWDNMTEEEKNDFYQLRKETLVAEINDPYRYANRLPAWGLAEGQIEELRNDFPNGVIQLAILGANRSSKTAWGDVCDGSAGKKDAARGWCLQSTQATSRADQQSAMFYQIPAEGRPESGKLKEGRSTKINYTVAGGFTDNTFVLPNGSQCWFKFYTMNVATIEGAELDFAWVDELVTPDWIEALRFRLITRAGILLLTFTPVEGYSPTVKEYLDTASPSRNGS
jgi:phage terminase large subunit-like protein